MQTYSLFELNEYIRRVMALNFQEPLWIRCELAQIKENRGNFYINLVEKAVESEAIIAQADAIIWHRKYHQLRRRFKKYPRQFTSTGDRNFIPSKSGI